MSEATAAAARPTEDAVLELQRQSESEHLAWTGTTGLAALGFLAAGFALLALGSHQPLSLVALAAAVPAYAIASAIEIEFPGFATLPTEAIFVVMWFVLPVQTLPLVVCGAMLLSRLPSVLTRRLPIDRLALDVASCWHALGPALVLWLAATRGPRWHDVPFYVAALAAQFVLDFASTFLLTRSVVARLSPLTHLRSVLAGYSFDTMLAPLGLLAAFPAYRHPEALLLLLPVLLLVSRIGAEREEKNTKVIELLHAYKGTALLLGDVIEADDAYTGAHSREVVELVGAVARQLGLDEEQQSVAEFTALVHDVGKVKIPTELLNKPGPLDADERALMDTHTVLGERMLEPIGGLLGEVGHLVRSSHERWDGRGYPDGFAAERIPLVARIVSACDAWSAMTADRPYRRRLSRHEAAAELRGGAGSQFDPTVVDALAAVLAL